MSSDRLDDDAIKRRILTVAHHLVGPDPESAARERDWICDDGRVTEDGRDLARAMGEQGETRSMLRNL
ncbi:MAG: hypothetical protein AAGI51_16180 [Pseudomonadota bacterium]